MGLGSRMAQEDPRREERETRDERENEHPSSNNTADTILLPAVCSFLSPC